MNKYTKVWFFDNEGNAIKVTPEEEFAIVRFHSDYSELPELHRKSSVFCTLTIGLVISLLIIVSYIVTSNIHELFAGGEVLFSTIYQLSLAYVASLIFYLVTIVIPREERKNRINPVIGIHLDIIIDRMESVLSELGKACIEGNVLNLDLPSSKKALSSIDSENETFLTIKQSVLLDAEGVKTELKELLERYHADLSLDLLCLLEAIKYTHIHSQEFADWINKISMFEYAGDDIIAEYKEYLEALKKQRKKCRHDET